MPAPRVGKEVLFARQIDQAVLDRKDVSQRFQKQAHGVARLERRLGDGLIRRDDRRLRLPGALRRKRDGRQARKISESHSGTPCGFRP